jgi:Zn-dependent protease
VKSLLLFGSNLTIVGFLAIIFAGLAGMTFHEFAHNYVAHLMGDPNPKRQGRLTLNPMVHINWPGFIMFVLIGFGVLGTAPISAQRMRNPRWGYLAAVAAGPFSNLLLALIAGLIFRIIPNSVWLGNDALLLQFIQFFVIFNVFLFLFNLLPFFPLDGWHITLSLLPVESAYWWQRNAQNTQYIFMGLILLSFASGSFLPAQFNILGRLLGDVGLGITRALMGY